MQKREHASAFFNPEILQWLISICCLLIFIGFTCSRALLSIGMIGILAGSLLFYRLETFKKYWAKKEFLILSLFFWIVLFSGINSEDKSDWLVWVRIKLPYLALPLAFAPLGKLGRRQFVFILYSFMLIFFVSTTIVLIRYFSNYTQINQSFLSGSTIPMPFSHIRYALMLSFSFFCAVYLLLQREYLFSVYEKWFQAGYALFAFAALHILAVRSGLLALYLGLLFIAVQQWLLKGKIILAIAVVLILLLLPFLVNRYMPSLHNKFGYMSYDLEQYREGKINLRSDAMRIVSMKIGVEVWQNNKWFGVGAGSLRNTTDKIYSRDYPEIKEEDRRLPHNQFIWVAATTGSIGFILFLLAFLYPVAVKQYYRHWLLTVFYLGIFSSFFTEVTLEEQMGTGFYLIFLMLLLNHFQAE